MTVTIVYRQRGSSIWTHRFRVQASQWRRFRAHARLMRSQGEYAIVRKSGDYVRVLA
jgi:hypothetical protein